MLGEGGGLNTAQQRTNRPDDTSSRERCVRRTSFGVASGVSPAIAWISIRNRGPLEPVSTSDSQPSTMTGPVSSAITGAATSRARTDAAHMPSATPKASHAAICKAEGRRIRRPSAIPPAPAKGASKTSHNGGSEGATK